MMRSTITLALLALLLAGCGTGQVRRVSEPTMDIQQLTVRADGSWSVDLRLQNFSNVPMRFDAVSVAMHVGGQAAGTLQGTPGLVVGPEAADVATLALSPTAAARIVVADAFARGRGVNYVLQGTVDAAAENGGVRNYRIKRSNALSPVPGLAGVMR